MLKTLFAFKPYACTVHVYREHTKFTLFLALGVLAVVGFFLGNVVVPWPGKSERNAQTEYKMFTSAQFWIQFCFTFE